MKKSLFTLALAIMLPATGMAAATFVSASQLSATSGYSTSLTVPLNFYDYVYGKSNRDVQDDQTVIYNADQANSSTFLRSTTITLTSLYNAVELDSYVLLQSFSYITRYNGAANVSGLYLQVYDSSGTLLGTSDVVSYDSYATDTSSYGSGTFTFSTDIVLSSSAAYTFTIVTYDEDAGENVTYSGNIGVGSFNPYMSSGAGYLIDGANGYTSSGTGTYGGVFSITTSSVPEPASAFLSLLGLGALLLRPPQKLNSVSFLL